MDFLSLLSGEKRTRGKELQGKIGDDGVKTFFLVPTLLQLLIGAGETKMIKSSMLVDDLVVLVAGAGCEMGSFQKRAEMQGR